MSLKLAAEHLKAQGRGPDTELVHMTKGEVQALKGIAHAHGGKLTTNPQTGLTEAGFLSSILPMVAGIALDVATDGALTPLVSGMIVGAGDYAMTGSLKQGLMAGLGAWGGAGLSEGFAAAGTEALGNAAIESAPTELADQSVQGVQQAFPNLTNTEAQAYSESLANANQGITQASQQDLLKSMAANNAESVSRASQAAAGIKNVGSSASALGDFASNNYGKIAAVAAPALTGLTQNPTLPNNVATSTPGSSSLKYISSDFQGAFPTQPKPAYQAQYPNYAAKPYNPYTPAGVATAAQGGAVEHFANTGSVKSEYDPSTYNPLTYMGNDSIYNPQHYMTKAKEMSPVAGDTSTYADTDPDTRNMSAYDTALTRLSKLGATPSAGLTPTIKARKMGTLNTAPAMVQAQQSAAQQAPTQLPEVEAAAGGMMSDPTDFAAGGMYPGSQIDKTQYASSPQMPASMQTTMAGYDPQTNPLTGEPTLHMASGGTTPYKPQYTNYQQTPYVQRTPEQLLAATAAYNPANIPTPTRSASMPTAGYAIDPMQMIGSPAYNAHQADLAAQAAVQQQALNSFNSSQPNGGGGDAAGGLLHSYASGGISYGLGGYSDGGRLLRGPGDGMSDNIPAVIGKKQPARLADGEFVVPADVVSHLGNGSTEAGAKHLYAMMDKIRRARTGRTKQAPAVRADKYIPK